MKRIEVTIGPTGETKVETKGFAGPSCQAASQLIEKALGRVTAEHKTAEYYRPAEQREQAKQH